MSSFGSSLEAYELGLSRRSTLGALLWRSAQTWGERPAITDLDQGVTHSYQELNTWVNRTAALLWRHGVYKGSRVAVVMRNRVEFVYLYFALARLGAVVVPLNYRLLPHELSALIGHAQCTHLIVDSPSAEALHGTEAAERIHERFIVGESCPGWQDLSALIADQPDAEWRSDVSEGDVFGFMYTAGTTGLPKASIKTHGEYTFAATAYLLRLASFIDVGPGVTYIATTPIFHGGGLSLLVPALYAGWHTVLLSAFTPEAFLCAVERHHGQVTWLVPTTLAACLNAGVTADQLEPLRVIVSAGAPLSASLRERAQQAWPHVVLLDLLGQTEACGPISCAESVEVIKRKPASLGKPILGVELCIQSLEGEALPPGQVGEICYRGPLLSQGYYRNPEATISAFRGGWFHSGDVGYLDADGDLYLVDRLGDMMITGGENVFPSEVEDILLSHPAVAEACVFGLPDEVWGDRVSAAVVVLQGSSADEEELISYCRSRLAPYKCPREIFFWDELPKSPVGKILRREARAKATAQKESNQR